MRPAESLVKIFSWIAVGGLLVFFIVAEVGLSVTQTFETNGQKQTRSFSPFGPPVRILQSEKTEYIIGVVGEPVYIDARLPILTTEADVSLWWSKGDASLPDPILGLVAPDDTFSLFPFTEQKQDGDFIVSTVRVPISPVLRRDGAYRFLISVPGVSLRKELFLHRLKIVAVRPSLFVIPSRDPGSRMLDWIAGRGPQ